MKTWLIAATVALQVIVLAYMAGEREWVLRTGRVIRLRTMPMYPRDAMRGDYVQLQYEMTTVPRSFWRDGLTGGDEAKSPIRPDTRVYASMRVNEDGLADFVSLSDKRPAEGLFIRGRTQRYWGGEVGGVRYGLEAFFVEHRQAERLRRLATHDDIQVPLEVTAAVRGDGLAVLKDYGWCAMGIGLKLQRQRREPVPSDVGENPVIGAEVQLYNAGPNEIAIVDMPGGRSLALVPNNPWGGNPWHWVGEDKPAPAARPENIVVLKPAQTYSMRVSFKDPYWFVVNKKKKKGAGAAPQSPADLSRERSATFRLDYRSPNPDACRDLPKAQLIWHGRLPSRIFTAAGLGD